MALTLREVQRQTEEIGQPISSATINRVEQGKVDPGVKRLHTLLRVYDLPVHLASDLLDIEDFAANMPPKSVPLEQLHRDGVRHWKQGRLREGMAFLLALRERQPTESPARRERQRGLLSFSIAAKNLGKLRIAHQIVENLLLEPPEPDLMIHVLVEAAVCWHWLGSDEVALALLSHAEGHIDPNIQKQRAWVFHERASTLLSMERLDEAESALMVAFEAYEKAKEDYGLCQAMGTQVRLAFARGDAATALETARSALEHAADHGFERLWVLRRIDEGRALFDIGETEPGLDAVHEALGKAVATRDNVLQFHAHHALWKAHTALDNRRRANLELTAAGYFVRFIDQRAPEAVEVRATASRKTRRQ